MTTEHVVFTNSRGEKLAGVLHGCIDGTAVVTCHGMLSTKEGRKHVLLAETLERRGTAALRFDFAGRGESEGSLSNLSFSSEVADLQAAIDFLASRGAERFGLFGSSLGGAVALLTAARDERIAAIATVAAIGHAAAAIERHADVLAAFEARGYYETIEGRLGRGLLDDAREHNILASVRVLHAPLLVIHGEDDTVVPASDAHDIATTARNASLEMVAGAGHEFDDPVLLRPLVRRVTDFLVEGLALYHTPLSH